MQSLTHILSLENQYKAQRMKSIDLATALNVTQSPLHILPLENQSKAQRMMSLDLATAINVSAILFALFVILWLVVVIYTKQPLADAKITVQHTADRVLKTD